MDPAQCTQILSRYRNSDLVRSGISYGTVPDFCDSWDHLNWLSQHGDLKNLQRPWTVKAVVSRVEPGGRILEIGGGEPSVSAVLADLGYSVTIVDPYDGSGYGPTGFDALQDQYPNIRFVRERFGSRLVGLRDELGSFDAVVSASVMEHLDLEDLCEVAEATSRMLSRSGWAIHALDFVRRGSDEYTYLDFIRSFSLLCGISSRDLDTCVESMDADIETYYLSAEAHNSWRMGRQYDEYPMRVITSLQIVMSAGSLPFSVREPSPMQPAELPVVSLVGEDNTIDETGAGAAEAANVDDWVGARLRAWDQQGDAGSFGGWRPTDVQTSNYYGVSRELALRAVAEEMFELRDRLVEHSFDASQCDRILDFGCGWGFPSQLFRDSIIEGRLVGMDFDRSCVAACQEWMPVGDWRHIEPWPILELATESIDFVYSANLFTHLGPESHVAWITELSRVVRPHGILALGVLKVAHLHGWCDLLQAGTVLWGMPDELTTALTSGRGEESLLAGELLHWAQPGGPERPADWGESVFDETFAVRHWPKSLLYLGRHVSQSTSHDWILARKLEA